MIKSSVLRLKTIKGRESGQGVSHVVGHITSVTPHVFSHRIRITSNLRKKQRCFWITFHFFNIPSLAFFHAPQAKKNGPVPEISQGEPWMGRNSAGSWLSGSLWAWVSSSAPSRQAKAPKFRFLFRSQLPHFDKQQQVTSHKILPPNFGEILKDFTCGGG